MNQVKITMLIKLESVVLIDIVGAYIGWSRNEYAGIDQVLSVSFWSKCIEVFAEVSRYVI